MGNLFTDDEKAILQDEELARQMQEEEDARFARQLQADGQSNGSNGNGNGHDTRYLNGKEPIKDEKIINGEKLRLQMDSFDESSNKPAPPPPPPDYANTSTSVAGSDVGYPTYTNLLAAAAALRAVDEQAMQQLLQQVQFKYAIYNAELEPEHETDYPCNCDAHMYMYRKWRRREVQYEWNKAVLYPGEKEYTNLRSVGAGMWSASNPYTYRVRSPYPIVGGANWYSGIKRASPRSHENWIQQTIALNNSLNASAQSDIDGREPKNNIWGDNPIPDEKKGKFKALFKAKVPTGSELRSAILEEEASRWPNEQWRRIVQTYQEKTGMVGKIAHLRNAQPIQYLHLLRAGYFEPIPVAWATALSNPLKFIIEPSDGWRGVTPAWRGYEDTAEERLYWVLNHREGTTGTRLKPDFISALEMARERMNKAVAPPPVYDDPNDVCHVQHKLDSGYSKQVMPPPFRPFDAPESANDDTMILLDVSGSMDFDPQRPVYDRYLITRYINTTQPKNKDVAKAIIRRFTDAMANHDRSGRGYDLVTFSSNARYIGTLNARNFDTLWSTVKVGGGTRVMTGWQRVKELHFQKHSASATKHPVYGWQAGPQTPILRLLLLLDGEATDMDEFELDLLGLDWAHVTIFLIGVDGCPHHHRHANELQRISDVNHHVSFVDAQGNTPERFVTHELLKRHLGYDLSMREFQDLEVPPVYSEVA